MLTRNDALTIIWKGYSFPMSIRSFRVSSEAKTATYEYAGTDGAEHERVKWYARISISGIFSSGSGGKWADYYIKKLKETDNNEPWTFIHPTMGSYKCILKNLDIEIMWDELETVGRSSIGTTYLFSFELWENVEPNTVKARAKVDRLFPAPNVRIPNANYTKTLAYTSCEQLYNALVQGAIQYGTDPLTNKDWLSYPYDIRSCAYNRYLANPNGEATIEVSDKNKKTYTVKAWDTWIKIANKYWVDFSELFELNRTRDVRDVDKSDQWRKWKTASKLYPWDVLLIPE